MSSDRVTSEHCTLPQKVIAITWTDEKLRERLVTEGFELARDDKPCRCCA